MSKAEIDAALWPRRSKFNVDTSRAGKERRTWIEPDGTVIVFASLHELEVYRDYVLPNVHVGVFSNVRRQVRFDLHATTPGGFKVKIGSYIADWTAQDRQGQLVVMDAKGTRTAMYKRSKRHVEVEYGIRILEL